MNPSQSNCPNCKKQKHVHEITGSTAFQNECGDCHNHRFCTVSDEAVYMDDKSDKCDKHDHYHDIRIRTDFTDKHFHEFQTATLIDSPTDFKCS